MRLRFASRTIMPLSSTKETGSASSVNVELLLEPQGECLGDGMRRGSGLKVQPGCERPNQTYLRLVIVFYNFLLAIWRSRQDQIASSQ
jgi:hypothetical protein